MLSMRAKGFEEGKAPMILEWRPISNIVASPPFGDRLIAHIAAYKGAVQQASLSAWNLLYEVLLANGLQIPEVAFTDAGKPYFVNSEIHFSLAHSKALCAVALSGRPVGVDIERRRLSYGARLIERSLSETEKSAFDGNFTRIWCRKEAVAKMTGTGITGYPNQIETTEYRFQEKQIEFAGTSYWLAAVDCCAVRKI